MEVSSSKSSSSLTASVLEALDYRAPHPLPDFRCAPNPPCVTVSVQLQQEMWKNPGSLVWKPPVCLVWAHPRSRSCYKSAASVPESFQTPRSTARTSRQGSEFPCCSPSSLAGSEQPCKEQHVLL